MQRNNIDKQEVTNINEKSPPRFTVNYHQHPLFGGMGHVSMQATHGDKTVELSVYPDKNPSLFLPLSYSSFFTFPIKATNKSIDSNHGGSPIAASYEIPSDSMTAPLAAFQEMEKITQSIDSGSSAFSITPNVITKILYAFRSEHVSVTNIHTGLKMFDREKIEDECNKVEVVNCAESVKRVLEAGGIKSSEEMCFLKCPTPSRINQFSKDRFFDKTADIFIEKTLTNSSSKNSIQHNTRS